MDANQYGIYITFCTIRVTQLRVQSTVTAITREGDEDSLPTEIQKVIWDNMTQFENDFQSF